MNQKKVIEYCIVSFLEMDAEEIINACIKNGWQPYGFPYSMPNDEAYHYQAMVKYDR